MYYCVNKKIKIAFNRKEKGTMSRYKLLNKTINLYTDTSNGRNHRMLENLKIQNNLEFRIIDGVNNHSTNYKFDDIKFSGCELCEIEISRPKSDGFHLILPLYETFVYSRMDRFALKGIEELTDDDYLKYVIMQLKKRTFLIDEVDISCVTKFHHNFQYGCEISSKKEEVLLVEEFDANGNPTGKNYDINDICPFSLNTEFLIISKSLADIYLDSLINNFEFVKIDSSFTLDQARNLKNSFGGNYVYVI